MQKALTQELKNSKENRNRCEDLIETLTGDESNETMRSSEEF